jgi:hypothetical protein
LFNLTLSSSSSSSFLNISFANFLLFSVLLQLSDEKKRSMQTLAAMSRAQNSGRPHNATNLAKPQTNTEYSTTLSEANHAMSTGIEYANRQQQQQQQPIEYANRNERQQQTEYANRQQQPQVPTEYANRNEQQPQEPTEYANRSSSSPAASSSSSPSAWSRTKPLSDEYNNRSEVATVAATNSQSDYMNRTMMPTKMSNPSTASDVIEYNNRNVQADDYMNGELIKGKPQQHHQQHRQQHQQNNEQSEYQNLS